MEKVLSLPRAGWSESEKTELFNEVTNAAKTGAPLRYVFEQLGERLGRKPNSVRNYYYMQVRAETPDAPRAAPFDTFTEQEVDDLLRFVLKGKAEGKSVRASVMELAGGDRQLMLRYQNKYRAVLRKRPERIRAIVRELTNSGLPALDPTLTTGDAAVKTRVENKMAALDPDAAKALAALEKLIDRALNHSPVAGDRLRVERDVALLRLEDMTHAANDMVLLCKEFVALQTHEQAAELADFCDELTHHITEVENAGKYREG